MASGPSGQSLRTPLIAGIDAGTTRIRALIFETDGTLLAQGSAPTPTRTPQPGWAEHEPQALWQATVSALRQALDGLQSPERVVGVARSPLANLEDFHSWTAASERVTHTGGRVPAL